MKLLLILLSILLTSTYIHAVGLQPNEFKAVADLKQTIFTIAESHKGEGDPYNEIQNKLLSYIDRLIFLVPQGSVEDRIELISGAWKQVWGPYEYKKIDRRGDPTTDPDNIYHVIYPGGYYYNVGNTLSKKNKRVKRTTLLRGEYQIVGRNLIKIKSTRLTKIKEIPQGLTHIDLPALSEVGKLKGERKMLPSFMVKKFPKGTMTELYTDSTMRILIGDTEGQRGIQSYLFVMRRVGGLLRRP